MAQQSPHTPSGDNSQRNRRRRLYDSLLTTFADLEGSSIDRKSSSRLQLESHLATMDVDFSTWDGNRSVEAASEDIKESSSK